MGNALGGTKYAIQDLGKLELIKGITAEGAGHFILGLGVAVSAIDIGVNGLNWSNGTDLAMSAIAFVPGVGWVISGSYFIGNMVVKHYTGKSIGDYIGKGMRNPIVQGRFIQMSKFPNF